MEAVRIREGVETEEEVLTGAAIVGRQAGRVRVQLKTDVETVSIGVIYGVMRTRLDYIEKKLDKHNNVAERVYKLEADSSTIFEKISVENNRIKDLEEWQTYEQRKE